MKFLILALMFISCGSGETEVIEVPAQQQQQEPQTGSSAKASFAEAKQIMNKYCLACHANSPWFQSEDALKRSGVKRQVANSYMPPSSSSVSMPIEDRRRLLTFFE